MNTQKNTTKLENYKGYTLVINQKKVRTEAKKGRKIIFSGADSKGVKMSIDSWVANIECGKRIDATPQGRSANINVIRK